MRDRFFLFVVSVYVIFASDCVYLSFWSFPTLWCVTCFERRRELNAVRKVCFMLSYLKSFVHDFIPPRKSTVLLLLNEYTHFLREYTYLTVSRPTFLWGFYPLLLLCCRDGASRLLLRVSNLLLCVSSDSDDIAITTRLTVFPVTSLICQPVYLCSRTHKLRWDVLYQGLPPFGTISEIPCFPENKT